MSNEKEEYTFLWLIENYSHCWHKSAECLTSPKFVADGLEGAAFILTLYPRGMIEKFKALISLFLHRSEVDDGPKHVPLKYEISLLAADGSCISTEELQFPFCNGMGFGDPGLVRMDEVLLRRVEYLPEDTLSVRCKIWKGEGNIQPIAQITARTRIEIKHVKFYQTVEGFSKLRSDVKETCQIGAPSKKECIISSSVYLLYTASWEPKIMVEITPSNPNRFLSTCKISLLDATGEEIECGEVDNQFDVTRKDILEFPLSLTSHEILDRKEEYLSDDKLSLACECVFSTGKEYKEIERISYDKPFQSVNHKSNNNQDIYVCVEDLSEGPSVLDDLKEIYSNPFLTDVELKTETKSFPAHKILLCARSPVFTAMMTNDMKEKNSNIVQVDDLEDDVVEQFLLFIYSDRIENLQWESAIKLYYAGDKYAVKKLKKICTDFLVKNVTVSSVCELLLLADKHSDCDLKSAVDDFIFTHEKEVYCSDEWENLIQTNPGLVSNMMLLIYRRKI